MLLREVILILLACLVGGLFGGLAYLPASYLAAPLAQLSAGRIVIVSAEGSVWQGQARLALHTGGATQTEKNVPLPGLLAWKIDVGAWLPPTLSVFVSGEPLVQKSFAVNLGVREIHITPGALRLPAELLETLGSPLNTLKPAGQLSLSWGELHVSALNSVVPEITGQLHAAWNDAQSGVTRIAPLGDYRLSVVGQGATGEMQLSTLRGPMHLNGTGNWHNGTWQFHGQAQADEKQRETLQPLLTWLGKMQPDGTVQWKLNHFSLDNP